MPVINDALGGLSDWLGAQSFSPPLREISLSTPLPAAAYPRLLIELLDERFAPHSSAVTARLLLRLQCSEGRPGEALATVRSLALQLRLALLQSGQLGGIVKQLAVAEISYSVPQAGAEEPQLLASAMLALELRYIEQ